MERCGDPKCDKCNPQPVAGLVAFEALREYARNPYAKQEPGNRAERRARKRGRV